MTTLDSTPNPAPRGARRIVRDLARVGAVAAAVMALAAGLDLVGSEPRPAAAANADTATIAVPGSGGQPLSGGGSATPFELQLPLAAGCAGDSANGGYRIYSYIVPIAVDPATLTYSTSGPTPAGNGAALRRPLFTPTGERYAAKLTALATTPGGSGQVAGTLPSFSFNVYGAQGAAIVPPGTYNIGIACTLGPESATQLDRFWNARITVTADGADAPGGFTWTAATAPDPSATTTTVPPQEEQTTTTTVPATSTTLGASTTTTLDAATTTTVADSTTTTIGIDSTSTTSAAAAAAGGGGRALPSTGGASTSVAIWAAVVVALGRIAVLAGRSPSVQPPRRR